ncbi:MAG TPA: hypothetical protein VEK11_00730, partial [Thermoanaerobaculia bacterium]|nr:hypothetical protein [Thermoanaerobaculia bacterium]
MFPLFMSGAGTASGVDYQGHAFAYVAAHVLTERFLPWFQDPEDVPVSIRMERRGPGDDLRVTMRNGRVIEVQAKLNAKGNTDFFESAARLIDGLLADPELRGVLLVNTGLTTTTVRVDFEEDRVRYVDGDPFEPRRVMEQVLAKLTMPFDRTVMERLRLVELNLGEGSMGEDSAQKLLASVLRDASFVVDAWESLGHKGVRAMAHKRHYDRDALLAVLARFHPRPTPEREQLDAYLDWAIETNAKFVLAALPDVGVDSFEAWDELTPPAQVETTPEPDAEAIRKYHAWEERRDGTSARDTYTARKLLEAKQSAIVIGGAGSGKSTLTHRLVREACEGGLVAMRVSLRQVGLALAAGKSIDGALIEAAFGGSAIDVGAAARLLARADFLVADGLDETDRAAVAEQLRNWMKGHERVALIITTRPVGHSSALLPGIASVELMALHAGGTHDVARAIFHAALHDSDRAEQVLERFEEELATNPAATLAARNPLLLSCLVALALEGRPLPRRRAFLIGEILDLLHRTPPHDRTPKVPELNARIARRVADLAGWFLAEAPASTRDELVGAISGPLASDLGVSRFVAHERADEALTFWEERRLVERLRSGTREYLTFVHLNLGEYAAARIVVDESNDATASWLKRVRRRTQWRQVILFAAALKDAERIASMLLDLDDASDDESSEAFLAAECLEAMDDPPTKAIVERTIDALAARLTRTRRTGAALVLIRLARLAAGRASDVALPLLSHPSDATRQAATAVVFAGDAPRIPAGLPRKWLEELEPKRPKREGGKLVITLPLPEPAAALLNETAAAAIDALFRTEERDEALAVASDFVATRADRPMLHALQRSFLRHDAWAVIEPHVNQWRATLMSPWFRFDAPERRDELLAFLDAIAASIGAPEAGADASRQTLPLVSRVFGALEVWRLDLEGLAERDDQESLELVIQRVLRGMRMDRDALRQELASGYRLADALTARGIFAHVREVAVAVNWRVAAAEPIEADRLRRALIHKSSIVRHAAFELVAEGAAAGAESDVLAGALDAAAYGAARELVQVIPQIVETGEAERLIRERVKSGSQRPWRLRGVFEGLAYVSSELRYSLRTEILTAVCTPNSMIAAAAIEALAKLEHDCTAEFVAILREAAGFWQARPLWCGWCEMEVAD